MIIYRILTGLDPYVVEGEGLRHPDDWNDERSMIKYIRYAATEVVDKENQNEQTILKALLELGISCLDPELHKRPSTNEVGKILEEIG